MHLLRRTCVIVFLLVGANGCRTNAPADHTALDRLLGLMQQRLALMHDVARWKWNEKRPIADPSRERQLLGEIVERGRGKGLDPERIRTFFAGQIEAAKLVQQADFDRWQADDQGPFPDATDLATLRQRIDTLNRDLLDALGEVEPSLSRPEVQEMLSKRATKLLKGNGIDPSVRETAIAPLRQPTSR